MIAVRIHIDPCGPAAGPLHVLPGSHRLGILPQAEIPALDKPSAVPCHAQVGDALLVRPLLLHSSPEASQPLRRRVLHLEYCAARLPNELEWKLPAPPPHPSPPI
jgi:ectoine hydroxylase-related dioxygenase (phytanoyl-CoA dioxygenase family)